MSEHGLIDLYYGDESRISLQPCVPYAWQFQDEEVFMPSTQGRGLNCFALLCPKGARAPTRAASKPRPRLSTHALSSSSWKACPLRLVVCFEARNGYCFGQCTGSCGRAGQRAQSVLATARPVRVLLALVFAASQPRGSLVAQTQISVAGATGLPAKRRPLLSGDSGVGRCWIVAQNSLRTLSTQSNLIPFNYLAVFSHSTIRAYCCPKTVILCSAR